MDQTDEEFEAALRADIAAAEAAADRAALGRTDTHKLVDSLPVEKSPLLDRVFSIFRSKK